MKRLIVRPHDFEVTLEECPPGLFVYDNMLGLKTEYAIVGGGTEAYVCTSGESFWGGAGTSATRETLLVIPVDWEWEEYDA